MEMSVRHQGQHATGYDTRYTFSYIVQVVFKTKQHFFRQTSQPMVVETFAHLQHSICHRR